MWIDVKRRRGMAATVATTLLVASLGAWQAQRPAAASTVGDVDLTVAGQIGGRAWPVTVRGSLAYVGVGPRVVAVDIAEPGALRVAASSAPLGGLVGEIERSGDKLVALVLWKGLVLLDPADLRVIGEYRARGDAGYGLAVDGRFAYVGEYAEGVAVVDLEDPAAPAEVGRLSRVATPYSLAAGGGWLLVGDEAGIGFYDLADPARPRLIAEPDGLPMPLDMALSPDGRLAYVGSGQGVHVLDIADPAAPEERMMADIGMVGSLVVVGDQVLATAGGLYMIDVAKPAESPVRVSLGTVSYPAGLAVADGHAYVAEGDRLVAYALPEPGGGSGPPDLVATVSYGRDIQVLGRHAFVADWDHGLQVVRQSDAAGPDLVATMATQGHPTALAVAGGRAAMLEWGAGLRLIDVTDPAMPLPQGFLPLEAQPLDVALAGDYAYVVESGSRRDGRLSGLRVVDVSDPTAPRQVGRADLPADDSATALEVADGFAYVMVYTRGLVVYDLADPGAPRQVGTLPSASFFTRAGGVAYAAGWLYVGDVNEGFAVVDVRDPTRPRLVGHLPMADGVASVAVRGNRAWLAGNGVHVLDISEPSAPREVGRWDTPGIADAVALMVDTVLVANRHEGLGWLSMAKPSDTYRLAEADLVGSGEILTVQGDEVLLWNDGYGGSALRGIRAVGEDAPSVSRVVHAGASWAADALLADGRAYVLDSSRLDILDLSDQIPGLLGSLTLRGVSLEGGPGRRLALDRGQILVLSRDTQSADGGFRRVDVSDPAAPVEVARFDTPGWSPRDMTLAGEVLYLVGSGDGRGDLRVVDLGDPAAPRQLGEVEVAATAGMVAVAGGLAYVGDETGLTLVDITDPARPVPRARLDLGGQATDAVAVPGLAYIALDTGVVAVEAVDPAAPRVVARHDTPVGAYGLALLGELLVVNGGEGGIEFLHRVDDGPILAPTPTPTPMPTPTRASDRSPGPARVPDRLYLPYVAANALVAPEGHSALLFDTSSAMTEPLPGPDALPRLEAARRLGRSLVGGLDLSVHSVGVVGFDHQAELLASGRNRSALEAAIGRLRSAGAATARVDLALAAALEDLAAQPRRAPGCASVVLVVGDRPDRRYLAEARNRAETLQAAWVRLHAVALGATADLPLLAGLTGAVERVHVAGSQAEAERLAHSLADALSDCGRP